MLSEGSLEVFFCARCDVILTHRYRKLWEFCRLTVGKVMSCFFKKAFPNLFGCYVFFGWRRCVLACKSSRFVRCFFLFLLIVLWPTHKGALGTAMFQMALVNTQKVQSWEKLTFKGRMSHEQWNIPWLFRFYWGLYFPLVWGLYQAIIRIPINQPV